MEDINIQGLIKYWLETAEYDYKTIISLFKSKSYHIRDSFNFYLK